MISLILNAIIPVFGLIIVGYIAAHTHLLGAGADKILTNFVYYFALPILFFVSSATEKLSTILNWSFLIAVLCALIISFMLGMFYSMSVFKKDTKGMAMRALASSCPNAAFIGIAVLVVLYGKQVILPAALIAIISALPAIASISILESCSNNSNAQKQSIAKVITLALIKNPLIVSVVFGVAYSATGLPLYAPLVRMCDDLGMASGACALFALGLSIYGQKISLTCLKEFIVPTIIKLIVQPLILLPMLLLLNVEPLWAAAALISMSLPTAAFLYILAEKYNFYLQTSITIVIGSTVLSIISLPIYIILAKHFFV